MKRLTPQQKKALSYVRDRRNAYGENDKASRRAIPLGKRKVVRAYRRLTNQEMPKNLLDLEPDAADEIDARVTTVRRQAWWKAPDIPLGEFVARQRRQAAARYGRKKRNRESRMK
jgi:hypothetical protein